MLLLASLAACGVSYHLQAEVPPPSTVAVLPFTGPASPPLRDTVRELLHSRLVELGYRVTESAWVDRVLSERGWLRDPADFDLRGISTDELVAALGVDAVATGADLGERSFNLLVLRRHSVGGTFEVRRAGGSVWWHAEHAATDTGGFLLKSGQVITELQAQLAHGTPMASLARIDELTSDLAGTLPRATSPERDQPPPELRTARVATTSVGADRLRFTVIAEATAGASVWFELSPHVGPVPMAPAPDEPTHFRGAQDLPAASAPDRVLVTARSPFGRTARLEVRP